jgi:hypothetical protein
MGEPYIGIGACVGIALNADNSGTFWGGTPGTAVALRPYPGTLKWEEKCKQSPVADLRVDEGHNVTGGVSYTGSFEVPLSYVGMELIHALLCGTAPAKTGATAPYQWDTALAEKLMYGAITYYNQERDGTAQSLAFTNAVVTALSVSCKAEEEARATVSWAAATLTIGTTALPTPTALEPVIWSHLEPVFNSVSTHRLFSVGFEISQEVSDGEFQMAAATPTAQAYIERTGQRTVSVDAEFLHDADVDTLAALTTGIVITVLWNNSGTTTAEREYSLVCNAAFREGRPETKGNNGVQKTSLKWSNRKAATPWAVQTKNGDDTIP